MYRKISLLICLLLPLTALPADAAEKLILHLDWFLNPDHGPLLVAQEKGYFAAEGLEVEMTEPSDPNLPPKLVAAGKGDLAISYQPQLHMQVDAGLPLVRIATLIATPLNSLVVLKESGITTIAGLKGKRIGYSVAGFETALMMAMLARAGLTLDDVTMININFALTQSLLAGNVEAVIGAYRNFELNDLDIHNRPGRAFFVEEEGVPAYDELIVIARRDRIGDKRLTRFVRALEKGVQYLINHPDESWLLFIKGRKRLDDELNRGAWRDTLRRFALRPAALDGARYERFAKFLHERKLIKSARQASDYAVVLR